MERAHVAFAYFLESWRRPTNRAICVEIEHGLQEDNNPMSKS